MTGFPRHSFKTLDGIRGVAAIAVMMSHFRYVMYIPAFKSGYLAVDIFFCLSGFVVACAYEDRLKNSLPVGKFIKIRFVRLWPMMAVGVLFGALIYFISAQALHTDTKLKFFLTSVLFNLAFIPMLFGSNDAMFLVNHPQWSLFYELVVNLFHAVFVRVLNLFQVMAILAVSFAVTAVGIFDIGNANFGSDRSQLLYGFGRVFFSYFAGVLLFRYRSRFAGIGSRHATVVVLLATAAACTLPVGNFRTYFDCLFILIGAPALVLLGSYSTSSGWVERLCVFLGVISYPLYAIHFPLAVLTDFLSHLFPRFHLVIAVAILISTVPLSYGLAKLYDEPVRRFVTRWWSLGRAAAA